MRIVTVLRTCAASSPGSRSIADIFAPNTVYNHPSIQSLADYIVDLVHFEGSAATPIVVNDNHAHIRLIDAMIERYSKGLELGISLNPEFTPVNNNNDVSSPSRVVVLLTGSTGNLGTQILSRLLKESSVHLVYALNRRSTRGSVMERQKKRFLDKGLDSSILHAGKMVFLEVENTLPKLGLSNEVYDEVRTPCSCL